MYLTRGWLRETVERFPHEYSEEYGEDVYSIPVKSMTWSEAFETVSEKILQLEKEATQKKQSKKAAQESALDVPTAAALKGNKDDKKSERQEAQAAKRVLAQNLRVSSDAAKALGLTAGLENQLSKMIAKGKAAEGVDTDAMTLCEKRLENIETWNKAAQVAVQVQERNKLLGDSVSPEALPALPFTLPDLKVKLKQTKEGMKAVKLSIPAPAAKGKSKAKAAQPKEADTAEEPKPKRRRGKSAPGS